MPKPYRHSSAVAYLESIAELAARGVGVAWCITDPKEDRCFGSISLNGLGGMRSVPRSVIGHTLTDGAGAWSPGLFDW